jgi:putative methionine-R-sulfoxide reductase with GAF domain
MDEMLLDACRDKPACSPIGLHGACGRSWQEQRSLVVRDVRSLGAGYIACDPRDLSEVVVPLFERDGSCWGVLDADSYEVGSFTESDALSLAMLMVEAGLSARPPIVPALVC